MAFQSGEDCRQHLRQIFGYESRPEPERRRHMIRLWLTFRERRPLADTFAPQNGYGRNQIAEVAFQTTEAA